MSPAKTAYNRIHKRSILKILYYKGEAGNLLGYPCWRYGGWSLSCAGASWHLLEWPSPPSPTFGGGIASILRRLGEAYAHSRPQPPSANPHALPKEKSCNEQRWGVVVSGGDHTVLASKAGLWEVATLLATRPAVWRAQAANPVCGFAVERPADGAPR